MTSKPFALALAAASLLALGACTTPGGLPAGQDNFGEAYRQTLQAQIIDPAPEYDTPFGQTSGAQVAGAIQRYRTGTVKQPGGQGISTIGRNTGGSGGASTSSSN
jgi:hypothetical protein